MEKVLFSEEQRHTQWWLWLILFATLMAVLGPFSYGIYVQEVLGKPYGDNPISTAGLIVLGVFSTLIMVFVIILAAKIRLIIKITNEGLFFSYPPIYNKLKKISPEEIDRYEIKNYRAIRHFGGHGIKRNRYGQAYIVSGNSGLQLYFKNGKKLLLGTQRKQALMYAMDKMMEKLNQ